MNSIENDNYWNESELSTFNFEQEDVCITYLYVIILILILFGLVYVTI